MRKRILVMIMVFAVIPALLQAQQQPQRAQDKPQEGTLKNENLDLEGKNFDQIIKNYDEKIQNVIQRYKMMENKDIKIIPYQSDYILTNDAIYIEKHVFLRDGYGAKVVGEKRKSAKFYFSGGALTKIESTVYERDYNSASEYSVEFTDPSPLTEGTEDITIKQYNKKKLVVTKTLADVKNTTAFPVRNDLKRDFYIQHITYFYNLLLSVAETYSKNSKDSDAAINEFLKSSLSY